MNTENNTMTADDAKRLEWLYNDTADAKRAPELCIDILVLGPLTIEELAVNRANRRGCDHRRALDSVLYDLGRISGLGGPVEYEGGFLKFRPEHRRAVLEWLYNYQVDGVIRSFGRLNFNNDEEVEP